MTNNTSTYRQPPISDYAIIGDCHGSALVARDGSIDWCALERFTADPLFCRLLDAQSGGALAFDWPENVEASRRYLPGTNILESTFRYDSVRVRVTDLMPVGRAPNAGLHDYVTLAAPHWLLRIVHCDAGHARIRLRCQLRQDYARDPMELRQDGPSLRSDRVSLYCSAPLCVEDDTVHVEHELKPGERLIIGLTTQHPGPIDLEQTADRYLKTTQAFWSEWSSYCHYRGPYHDAVERSALALKLLTYAPTGAIAAAPTTSLPEWIGGARNWDYRYCWPRDASFILFALGALGYDLEGDRFGAYLEEACHATLPNVQIMYGIDYKTQLVEHELHHLAGYRDSRPVRIGNGAYTQRQLDVYGEILDWADLHASTERKFRRQAHALFSAIEKLIEDHWHEGDSGLWEMRGPPRHHTFGKVMCWVGLDRLNRLIGKSAKRHALQELIRNAILSEGLDSTGSHLVGSFGQDTMNAALLLVPMVGFPVPDDVLRATVEAVQQRLQRGEYVQRYEEQDGVSGSEGAFLACSFWLVDALLTIDRVGEAEALFERLLTRTNDLGLLSEEVDPASGELLGNFPQGLTHLALIQNAVNFKLHETHGARAIRGAHSDRGRLVSQAIEEFGSLWATVKKSEHTGRIRSSHASIMQL
ncbi:MAG: glycoside hydrolase family 15 protein [Planctomycetota bacterium]|nr:MAG: glycoside hydrolase family 15 protein [Planctomycetota bacterium]